ncbi:hypothetical protein F1847_02605 [Thermodesulfobacterium sp. TA1]|uniref:hypothetical protein n=1 Tax=Thermodesulfobacterium sp. TA1 TaxID=2234087 RepID=UPI0012327732|nr:hypothetical protein [Thermodesulfobacterium sp. TA1]QER41690.1 hypothetical protein F1847_02605 [Thermodesulfobacterium sp. TA1]
MKTLVKVFGFISLFGLLISGISWGKKEGMVGGKYYPPNVNPSKVKEFCQEIQPLWQKQWQLSSEVLNLWGQNPPNWEAILQKEMEIQRLRVEIQKKAYEKGLPYGPRKGLNFRKLCGW